jgi:DNA-binding PadR family transcriptional regulator
MKKLTRRQQMVLGKFLDLYRDGEEALHYTIVAEKLEVNPVTAYDMLRLLEDRGLLTTEFVPPSQREGSGRAKVLFSPTPAAQALLDELAGETWQQEEWDVVRERTLQALHEGKGSDYQELLDDLLLRIANQRSPLLYTAEMITAVILQAYQLQDNVSDSVFFDRINNLGLPNELSLNAFGGLAVGLSFVERANRRVTNVLLTQTDRYQEMTSQLTAKGRRRLTDFVGQVIEIVES